MERLEFTRRAWLSGICGLALAAIGERRARAADRMLVMTGDAKDHMHTRRGRLAGVRKWGCQFQNTNIARIQASNLDLIAVDHALGEPGRVAARPDDVARLKTRRGGGSRIVLAYLSVGEAENYRPYWQEEWKQQPPSWLGPSNVKWPGSYVAKYWERGWQDIVFSSPDSLLNKIIAAGFDGVFLDRVDAYIDWERERPAAPGEMVELISALAAKARSANPGFLLVSQNSEPLLRRKIFRDFIDGVSKESLLYGLSAPEVLNSDSDIAWSLTGLNAASSDGIPVFAIEYLSDPQKKKAAESRLLSLGYRPFFANRALDRLPDEISGAD